MSDDRSRDISQQSRQAELAQEIFVRDRGANRQIPFNDFLTRIEGEAREQVREERRKRPRDAGDASMRRTVERSPLPGGEP